MNSKETAKQPDKNFPGALPKKIMLAIDGLGLGGAEMVVLDLAKKIDREKFDVCICCTKGLGGEIGQELLDEGYDVFVLPNQSDDTVDYFTALKFRRAILDRKVDLVHTHASPALFDAAPSRLFMPKLKLVHTFHYGNYPYDSWRHHYIEHVCTRAADRLIAVGIEQSKKIQETYKLAPSRIDTVWNGIHLPKISSDNSFKKSIGTGSRILVGTIAKLIEQKGLDDLLKVARQCLDKGLNMQFVIVGEGHLRNQLEERRKQLGLEDTVVITGWIHNAAPKVLPEVDVFFQSSRWEAMSIAILEAMASGKAIVATKVGDNPHVLENGVSGLLVDSRDIDGMIAALERLQDNDLRETLGESARKEFENKFTLEHMIQRYENVYDDLLYR